MARVTGPLMSIDASGTLAGAIVFAKWRGRNYVRRHAIPANPRSPAQLAARSIIAFLGAVWKSLTAPNQATWLPGAESLKISAFNEYIRINARNWRDGFAPSQETPATRIETVATPITGVPVVSGRQVQVPIGSVSGGDNWGLVLCRSLVTGFTPSPSNAVAIVPAAGFLDAITDGPLAPGTYFYNCFIFSIDGLIGAAGGEDEAVVT